MIAVLTTLRGAGRRGHRLPDSDDVTEYGRNISQKSF